MIATFILLALPGSAIAIAFFIRAIRTRGANFPRHPKLPNSKDDAAHLRTQLQQQEQVFAGISREIHDHISLSLTLSKLHLNMVDLRDQQATREKIELSKELLSQAIRALHQLCKTLNLERVGRAGFLGSVENEVHHLEKTGLFTVALECRGKPWVHDAATATMLFRIFEEAVHNIIRHSKAATVTIRIAYSSHQLECLISDNGKGFASAQTLGNDGAGITNMKHRASSIGAFFKIESAPGEGTTITILLPNANL